MTYRVWGLQLEIQNLLSQNHEGDDNNNDDGDGAGEFGVEGLKT